MKTEKTTFKDRLELIMKEKNLNANSLAHEVGTNAVNIYRYLGDAESTPTNATYAKIATLGYSIEWLKNGTGNKYPSEFDIVESDPLMQVVDRIEKTFAGMYANIIEQKDKTIQQQDKIIASLERLVQSRSGQSNFKILGRETTRVNKQKSILSTNFAHTPAHSSSY